MAFQEGKLMRLEYGGKEVFHEVSVDLSGSTAFKDVATKDTDGTVSSPGSKSWSCACEGIVSVDTTTNQTLATMIGFWNAQSLNAVNVTDNITGHTEFSGSAYVEGWNIKSQNEEFVTFSYTLKGDGPLTVGAVTP